MNTTHDWNAGVDRGHLESIRARPDHYAPGGLTHLVLEVIAYAQDEAEAQGRPGLCVVTFHAHGSVSVTDDGRGTDTRQSGGGEAVKKPVMGSKDIRFFDPGHDVRLPDGELRRGMSVVAALSRSLVHTNRRAEGAWVQRYEYGVPTSGLIPIPHSPRTGTTVQFQADPDLISVSRIPGDRLRELVTSPALTVEVVE